MFILSEDTPGKQGLRATRGTLLSLSDAGDRPFRSNIYSLIRLLPHHNRNGAGAVCRELHEKAAVFGFSEQLALPGTVFVEQRFYCLCFTHQFWHLC